MAWHSHSALHAWLHPDAAAAPPGGRLPDPVSAALPLFLLLIAIEAAVSWQRTRLGKGPPLYNLRQTSSNLAAGTLAVLLGLFVKALQLYPFLWIRRHGTGRLPWLPQSSSAGWLGNAIALLVCDLGFYWQHRAMHAANVLWAAHVAHHSSPDYNLSTALRQGAGEALFSWLFYLPMAFFCPPDVYALHRGLSTVYQFFVHTQLVGRCWWPVEAVMNTPSHHRVHHARNYGRRNFAGVLIIWDRAFGTFEAEQSSRPCVYGLNALPIMQGTYNRCVTCPPNPAAQPIVQGTYNPLWHQAHHLAATLRLAGSGKVPVWCALLTRAHGPGMVAPTVTDAEPGPGAEPPAGTPSRTRAGTAGTAGTQPQCATQPTVQPAAQAAAATSYPWERRPLGPLDWYAAAAFFLVTLPGSLAVLSAAGEGTLSPAWMLAGAGWSAWSVTTAAWLFGGTQAAAVHEVIRLLAQLAAALGLLRWGVLPQTWGPQLACGAALLSLASLAFLSTQLAQLGAAGGKEPAEKAAATPTEGAAGVSEAGDEGKKAA